MLGVGNCFEFLYFCIKKVAGSIARYVSNIVVSCYAGEQRGLDIVEKVRTVTSRPYLKIFVGQLRLVHPNALGTCEESWQYTWKF